MTDPIIDPMTMYLSFRFAHILGAALWVGALVGVPTDLNRTLKAGMPHTLHLISRITWSLRLSSLGGLITVGSGFGVIVYGGGFAQLSRRTHLGLALALLLFAFGILAMSPMWHHIRTLIRKKADAETIAPLARRMAIFVWTTQAVWILVLALMVFRAG